jgi:hypothetical protein
MCREPTHRILPILSLLFLCSFLDRTNVGNAKIIGLERDLGLTNLQYNQGLAVFYATYIARLAPYLLTALPPLPTPTRTTPYRNKHPQHPANQPSRHYESVNSPPT